MNERDEGRVPGLPPADLLARVVPQADDTFRERLETRLLDELRRQQTAATPQAAETRGAREPQPAVLLRGGLLRGGGRGAAPVARGLVAAGLAAVILLGLVALLGSRPPQPVA